MEHRGETCCFTGHRDVPLAERGELMRRLNATVRELIARGYRYFGAGGAVGFDTMAAQTVLDLRREFPQIKLILVLPCGDQASRFPPADAFEYRRILGEADKVAVLHDRYVPGCMLERNRRLVEYSSVCVAYCRRENGGTAYTLREARRSGMPVMVGKWSSSLPIPDAQMTPEGRIALERVYTSEQLGTYEKCPAWFFNTWKTSGMLAGWDARVALATFERGMIV